MATPVGTIKVVIADLLQELSQLIPEIPELNCCPRYPRGLLFYILYIIYVFLSSRDREIAPTAIRDGE